MTSDLLTGTLAEEIAANPQLRIWVPTTPATRVAALAARELGSATTFAARPLASDRPV